MMDIPPEKITTNAQPACKQEVESDNTRQENGEHHHPTRLVRIPQGFYEYVISIIHVFIHALSHLDKFSDLVFF